MAESSRSLAARALEVPPDADPAAARAAFLAALPRCGFVPEERTVAAAARLAGPLLPRSLGMEAEQAEFERADLDEFLARYWLLAPSDRRRRWRELDDSCGDYDVRDALARVEAGLDVPTIRHEDWAIDKLAQFVREGFLLAPRARSIRRWEWIASQPPGPLPTTKVRRFRDVDPLTAALDPELIKQTIENEKLPFAVEPLAPVELARLASGAARPKSDRLAAIKEFSSKEVIGSFFLLIVVIRIVVGIAGSGSSSSPSPRPFPFPGSRPTDRISDAEREARRLLQEDIRKKIEMKFTDDQIREFQNYRPVLGQVPPKGYTNWVLVGRPGPSRPAEPAGK
jgi:hypothetical protein